MRYSVTTFTDYHHTQKYRNIPLWFHKVLIELLRVLYPCVLQYGEPPTLGLILDTMHLVPHAFRKMSYLSTTSSRRVLVELNLNTSVQCIDNRKKKRSYLPSNSTWLI